MKIFEYDMASGRKGALLGTCPRPRSIRKLAAVSFTPPNQSDSKIWAACTHVEINMVGDFEHAHPVCFCTGRAPQDESKWMWFAYIPASMYPTSAGPAATLQRSVDLASQAYAAAAESNPMAAAIAGDLMEQSAEAQEREIAAERLPKTFLSLGDRRRPIVALPTAVVYLQANMAFAA